MKPKVYFDFESVGMNKEEVVIKKKRLEEIFDEIYQAGVEDGRNMNGYVFPGKDNSILTPTTPLTSTTPWTSNAGTITPTPSIINRN